jgi:lipopolysaccharide export system permease protein
VPAVHACSLLETTSEGCRRGPRAQGFTKLAGNLAQESEQEALAESERRGLARIRSPAHELPMEPFRGCLPVEARVRDVDEPRISFAVDEHVSGVQVPVLETGEHGTGRRSPELASHALGRLRPGRSPVQELDERRRACDEVAHELPAGIPAPNASRARNTYAALRERREHACFATCAPAIEESAEAVRGVEALDQAALALHAFDVDPPVQAALQVHRLGTAHRRASYRSAADASFHASILHSAQLESCALKLQLYLLRQLLLALVFAVGAMLFIAFPCIAAAAVHKLENANVLLVFNYLPIVLQNLAPYVIPMGFLLAVVATYGRLAAENEWTAILMAGFRPHTMFLPAAAIALALGSGMYWMVSEELPNLKKREKEFLVAALRSSILHPSPGRNGIEFGGFILNGSRDGDLFREAYIRRPGSDGEAAMTVRAETARLQLEENQLLVEMTGVETVGTDNSAKISTEHVEWTFDLSEFVHDNPRAYTSQRYRTSGELRALLRGDESDAKQKHEYEYELHSRYAMSASCLLFLLLGAPTGLILRRGSRLGALAVAVSYALVYYLLSMRLGKELGIKQAVPAAIAAWSTTGLGSAIGLFLMRRAVRR